MAQDFQFKYFTISQKRAALKVGTDSMLLGALVNAISPKYALDLGAGTGVLSLMLCQKFPSLHVDAIEIEEGAYQDCLMNFQESRWSDQLNAMQGDYFNHLFSNHMTLLYQIPLFTLNKWQILRGRANLRSILQRKGSVCLFCASSHYWLLMEAVG